MYLIPQLECESCESLCPVNGFQLFVSNNDIRKMRKRTRNTKITWIIDLFHYPVEKQQQTST